MIKVVALDLVGVLLKEKDIELNVIENKLERLFGDNLNDTDYLEKTHELVNNNDIVKITYGIINKIYEPVDTKIFTKLKGKNNSIKFIIATNHVSYVRQYIKKTFSNVDDIIISAEIGEIKPNKNFYKYILNKYNIKPEELLFLDDNIKNVDGAASLGVNSIKVDKDTDIYEKIHEFMKNADGIYKIENSSYLNECLNVIHASFIKRDIDLGYEPSGHSILSYNDFVKMFDDGIQMYGYFLDNKIVGFISFDVRDDEIKVKDIVVLPEYQNNGIGTLLLDFVKDFSLKNKIKRIFLAFYFDNKKLMEWYEKNSFKLYNVFMYEGSDKRIGFMEYIFD